MIIWWNITRTLQHTFWRCFCAFGYHRDYDGLFYTEHKIHDEGQGHAWVSQESYKCYHCHYCDKPLEPALHDDRIDI